MGLKKGEKIKRINQIRIISTKGETLWVIDPPDVIKEGFPGWTTNQFNRYVLHPQ